MPDLRVGRILDKRNSQNSSKYQAKNSIITKLRDKRGLSEVQAPHYAFNMLYSALIHNLNLWIACCSGDGRAQALAAKVYILIDG
ncbi:MAG: hypothetical protein OXN20_05255 [Gemmatimonadota bacterium]|nr:hypothetical protein [Gemmatimonadota bacterium]